MASTVEEFRRKFGENLRRLRKDKGLSAEVLAHKGELTDKTYVHAIERGEKDIQLSTIFKIAKGLEVEPKDLLTF